MQSANYKTILILIFLLVSFGGTNLKAQVTIGSGESPVDGALLDLKEWETSYGESNSNKGLSFPRVELTNEWELFPMFTGSEPDYQQQKANHVGLVVYNTGYYFWPNEQGLYVWNGYQWIALKSTVMIHGMNGIMAFNEVVELGGYLNHPTEIELGGQTLNFSTMSGGGAVSINENDPQAYFHMNTPDDKDPIIVNNIKNINEPLNPIDDSNSVYYDLKVSSNGVIRKVEPIGANEMAPQYELSDDLSIPQGSADGSDGAILNWNKEGVGYGISEVMLPQDGGYVFSFRLNGATNSVSVGEAASFYISAFKDSHNGHGYQLFDIAEMVLVKSNKENATYSINLSLTGKRDDSVQFRISKVDDSSPLEWMLKSNPFPSEASRTSMIFWKM